MQTTSEGSDQGAPSTAAPVVADRAALFAVCWAAAALFHLAGNPRALFLPDSVVFTLVQLGVGAAAVAVLLRPRSELRLAVLCTLIPVSAWLEAPIVGNHWVLAAAISLAFLAAIAGTRLRSPADATQEKSPSAWSRFAPTARLTLLIAYGFAAFAKLNSGFFDPAVSCAVYYQDQLVRSWGLAFLSATGRPLIGTAMAVGAAAVELSVPVLLTLRRTRRAGLVLALGFHWMLAMDLAQHFWDFSSVLFAGFLLFLDDAQVEHILGQVRRGRAQVRPFIVRGLLLAVALAVLVVGALVALPEVLVLRTLATLAGHGAWTILGTGTLALVLLATLQPRAGEPWQALRVPALPLLLVPALVLANGLTPYLELKTGFGWNMYGNLRTVAGDTNHFIVPRTIDLTGLQTDQVEILESSDPALERLIGTDYALPYSEFREYAHLYPDESVTYRRAGVVREASPLRDDEAGRGGVSTISRRLQSFRVIDTSPVERCQPAFSPAR